MDRNVQTANATTQPLAGAFGGWLRQYVGGRRSLILLFAAFLAAGASLNWGWLVTAGIAPQILALVPCAAMCALGLCINKMGGTSCSGATKPADQASEASTR
jgi:hypothetical protein